MHCGSDNPPVVACGDAGVTDTGASNEGGSVVINVTTPSTDCPNVTGIMAAPYGVNVGSSAVATATIKMPEAGPATIQWTAPSGMFTDPTAAQTAYVCATPGSVSLSVTATFGGCADTATVPIDCLAQPP